MNGTRLIVLSLHDHFINAKILTGTHKIDRVHIPRIDLAQSETHGRTIKWTIKELQSQCCMMGKRMSLRCHLLAANGWRLID